jgi:HAE1 family hydrophobic/amphiphilic exporter-1
MLERWFARPATVAAVLSMLLALAVYFLPRIELGQAAGGGGWSVIIEEYGLDAREIERGITEPLESALASVGGIRRMRSVTEFGKVRVDLERLPGADRVAVFLGVRDAVDRVWRTLPSSVQKPRLFESSGSQSPAFIVALESAGFGENVLRAWVEAKLKPAFAKIDGVGEIELGGGEQREAVVRLDEAALAARGLDFDRVARTIQASQLLAPAGGIDRGGARQAVALDGRFGSLEALAELRLSTGDDSGGTVRLGELGDLEWSGREPDSVSRVNGERRVTLYVHASGDANPVLLSRALRAETAGLQAQGLSPTIVFDRGEAVEAGIQGITTAMLEGLLVVLLFLPLAMGSWRQVIGVALALPVVLLFCLGCFAAAGIALDAAILAGLAVGVSSILDTFIIVAEQHSLAGVRRILPALVQSFLTVFLALVPLVVVDAGVPGGEGMVWAIAVMLGCALVVAAIFLPLVAGRPDLGQTGRTVVPFAGLKRLVSQRCARPARRIVGRIVLWSADHALVVVALGTLLSAGAIAMTLAHGMDFDSPGEDGSLFVHIEGAPEASLAAMDRDAARLWEGLRDLPGLSLGESLAHQGNAQMTLRFDPARIDRASLAAKVRQAGAGIKGIFVYLPDAAGTNELSLELAVSGDDDAVLRDLAKAAARELGRRSWVSQTVLNFKDPPQAIEIRIDQARAATAGRTAAEVAGLLRFSLYGPVVAKWFDRPAMRECDLRLRGGNALGPKAEMDRSGLGDVVLPGRQALRLATVAQIAEVPGSAKIYHQNRQRTACFTVRCRTGSVGEAVDRIWGVLHGLSLPGGYAFAIDPRAQELETAFLRLGTALAVGLVLIYLILAACAQSCRIPWFVLAIVPPSLALPVLVNALAGGPIRLPVAFGLVILAGMAVNASILVMEEVKPGADRRWMAWRALRGRLRPLAVTVGAAELGCLPLLFAPRQASGFMGSLSHVIIAGILASLVATLTIIPALLRLVPVQKTVKNHEGLP